jgi:hypothetical protein
LTLKSLPSLQEGLRYCLAEDSRHTRR